MVWVVGGLVAYLWFLISHKQRQDTDHKNASTVLAMALGALLVLNLAVAIALVGLLAFVEAVAETWR